VGPGGYLCAPYEESVANHASSKKRIRQTATRTERNKHFRTTTRSAMKRVREALATGKKKDAETALKGCVALIDRAVTKGLWHRRAGSRYISRLTSQVGAMKK
jgi:small subunit ribosomal protein S20